MSNRYQQTEDEGIRNNVLTYHDTSLTFLVALNPHPDVGKSLGKSQLFSSIYKCPQGLSIEFRMRDLSKGLGDTIEHGSLVDRPRGTIDGQEQFGQFICGRNGVSSAWKDARPRFLTRLYVWLDAGNHAAGQHGLGYSAHFDPRRNISGSIPATSFRPHNSVNTPDDQPSNTQIPLPRMSLAILLSAFFSALCIFTGLLWVVTFGTFGSW